ncbi:MAG: hypothetical protein ACP5QA_02140 [Phycisphaerae bacterium]
MSKKCANCNEKIGNLEVPFDYGGKIVCERCYKRLASASCAETPSEREIVAPDSDVLSSLAALQPPQDSNHSAKSYSRDVPTGVMVAARTLAWFGLLLPILGVIGLFLAVVARNAERAAFTENYNTRTKVIAILAIIGFLVLRFSWEIA